MRNIVSPLSGFASPFGQLRGSTSPLALYAAAGITPQLVADFKTGTYGKGGALSTFDGVLEHSRAGLATMVDADGVLKWCPHNIFPTSIEAGATYADFGGAVIADNVVRTNPKGGTTGVSSVTSSDGTTARQGLQASTSLNLSADYTYVIWINPESAQWVRMLTRNESSETQATYFDLVNGVIGTSGHNDARITLVDNGYYLIEVDYNAGATDATTALLNLEPTDGDATSTYTGDGTIAFYLWGTHLYRSDLGGMADNPATGNSYVPTTSAARYLPRENHHVWNGTAWVKEGYLHEPEAATNLVSYSDLSVDWGETRSVLSFDQGTSPDGTNNATKLSSDTTADNSHTTNELVNAPTDDSVVTGSVYLKQDTLRYAQIRITDNAANVNGGLNNFDAHFDLQDGVITGTANYNGTAVGTHADIEDVGNGWYRCSIGLTKQGDTVRTDVSIYLTEFSVVINNPGFTGTGTESILIYGAQFEASSVPTSYIPTSGSTVTRAADILTLPIENIPYPEPVVIGEELFSDFATEGEWVDNGDGSWTVTNATADTDLRVAGTTTLGKHYQYSFDITTTAALVVYTGQPSPKSLSTESYTVNNVDTAGFLIFRANAGTTATVSNISVREINPLAVSFGYKALVTYADTGATNVIWYDWRLNSANYLQANLRTQSTATGEVYALQAASGVTDDVDGRFSQYSPGINVPMSLASRHGSTFINVAVDGVALTADTTPTAFPDLSATDLVIAPSGGPQVIQEFIMWGGTTGDIGDVGIAEASA